jgi:hypothetical protein
LHEDVENMKVLRNLIDNPQTKFTAELPAP